MQTNTAGRWATFVEGSNSVEGPDEAFSLLATLKHYEVEELTLSRASQLLGETSRHRAAALDGSDGSRGGG